MAVLMLELRARARAHARVFDVLGTALPRDMPVHLFLHKCKLMFVFVDGCTSVSMFTCIAPAHAVVWMQGLL